MATHDAIPHISTQPFKLSALALAGLLAGPFLTMVDSVIVNVALPDIATQLHAGLDVAQWVLSGYLLALAAGLAASAYLAKRFGTRRVYLVSMVGFTLASALCAVAPTIDALIALRALQGVCGAPLVPLAMTMLMGESSQGLHFPPAAGVILFLAPAMGPTLGGVLINLGGWPLIFLINVPVGVIGTLGVLRLPGRYAGGGDLMVRFDLFGVVLLAGGSVLALYGATLGPQHGWTAAGVWPLLAAGGALLLLYVIWALVRRHPAVDLKLLRHSQTALAVAISALAAIVMFAMLFLLPIYMEELQEQVHIGAVLQQFGLPASFAGQTSNIATTSQLPPAVRTALGDAAIAGFHDTILLLVALSTFGCLATLLLRSPRRPPLASPAAPEEPAALLSGHESAGNSTLRPR